MIELDNIEKNYYFKKKSIFELSNINLTFDNGKLYGIMGPSGSGKSTLIQLIGLLINPTSGSIKINNVNTSNIPEKDKTYFRKEQFGYIFQSFYLISTMNVTENIMLPLLINKKVNKKDRIKYINNLLKKLGLENRGKHYPNQLSRGEQQRVAIARALCNDPNIILADEPTGSLDENNTIKIFEILKGLAKEGKCVIVVCHDDIIKKYANNIIYLNDGMVEISDENS